jgi:rhamnogalacturonyl hydrolase YesR
MWIKNLKHIKLLVYFFISYIVFLSYPIRVTSQDISESKKKLLSVVNAVLNDATFHFIDKKSGQRCTTTDKTPLDVQLQPESAYTDWRYWNGVLNIAMIRLSDVLHEPTYLKFAIKNITFSFDNYQYFESRYKGEGKWNYPFAQHFIMEELDDCGAMGASVIEVFQLDPQERYKTYITKTANHILTKQSRLNDGTFVRSFPNRWTLWADDLYMSISFLSRMGEFSGDIRYFDEAAQQVINFYKYLFNKERELMYHCWYSDIKSPGVAFWGRANGWAMLAQVDLLDRLPSNHPQRSKLLNLLKQHILGVSRYQSSDGLWHQLLDKVDSYLETSCSAMFTYVIARAVNKGYIKPRYTSIAQKGWEGVMSKIHIDGQVEGVCTGTVISEDLVYYYHRPTPLNDVHGIGFVLLAGAEILQMSK